MVEERRDGNDINDTSEPVGDRDLHAPLILTVVGAGALVLVVIVLALRAFVYTQIASEEEMKVVRERYSKLRDYRIEEQVLLGEYGVNPDGDSGRIPIDEAIRIYVKEQRDRGGTP